MDKRKAGAIVGGLATIGAVGLELNSDPTVEEIKQDMAQNPEAIVVECHEAAQREAEMNINQIKSGQEAFLISGDKLLSERARNKMVIENLPQIEFIILDRKNWNFGERGANILIGVLGIFPDVFEAEAHPRAIALRQIALRAAQTTKFGRVDYSRLAPGVADKVREAQDSYNDGFGHKTSFPRGRQSQSNIGL